MQYNICVVHYCSTTCSIYSTCMHVIALSHIVYYILHVHQYVNCMHIITLPHVHAVSVQYMYARQCTTTCPSVRYMYARYCIINVVYNILHQYDKCMHVTLRVYYTQCLLYYQYTDSILTTVYYQTHLRLSQKYRVNVFLQRRFINNS